MDLTFKKLGYRPCWPENHVTTSMLRWKSHNWKFCEKYQSSCYDYYVNERLIYKVGILLFILLIWFCSYSKSLTELSFDFNLLGNIDVDFRRVCVCQVWTRSMIISLFGIITKTHWVYTLSKSHLKSKLFFKVLTITFNLIYIKICLWSF